jgi:hypothetical protein
MTQWTDNQADITFPINLNAVLFAYKDRKTFLDPETKFRTLSYKAYPINIKTENKI